MEKEILERANKGETSHICGPIGAGLGRVDQTGVTVTTEQSSYVGRLLLVEFALTVMVEEKQL